MSTPISRVVVIRNSQGLHARPAEMMARTAQKFRCKITVRRDNNEKVDARSIMDLLTLGALPETELVLEAEGDDAAEAIEVLAAMIENGFPDEPTKDTSKKAGGVG
jgi:phosphotransferase system HPr (HPr) family protein